MDKKKTLIFLTATRADFGKLKALIHITDLSPQFDVHVFITGMHMQAKYGSTAEEIERCSYNNTFKFINHSTENRMDLVLSRTVEGFSAYCREIEPDLIVVHGDRVEPMAGAIVGSMNNILVLHIEGGEISGTIDELLRHSISKLSHIHCVANDKAKKRLIQMGEDQNNVHVIGSPDIDLMNSSQLPSLESVKKHYDITFEDYGILLFHPVTTELDSVPYYAQSLVEVIEDSIFNYVVIFPNNDIGSSHIIEAYEKIQRKSSVKIFPSVRFESFLVLLKNAQFLLGNSSAGIRETPYYGVPSVNIGTRQFNRGNSETIIDTGYKKSEIISGIKKALTVPRKRSTTFGTGNSSQLFIELISRKEFWNLSKQKYFKDIN